MAAKKKTDTGSTPPATTFTVIQPPNFQTRAFRIIGTAPLVVHAFSKKAQQIMLDEQMREGAKKAKKKEPRKIDEEVREALHLDIDGRAGFPASAIRSAMIDACRMANFQMTRAKMSVFCEADTLDVGSGQPLFLIQSENGWEENRSVVRLASGVAYVAVRPMWREWWADVRLTWDGDQFSEADVANLLMRAGLQVGIGEGRPYSKQSHGMGWGTFRLASIEDEQSGDDIKDKAA